MSGMVPAESGVDLHRLNLGLFSSAEEERIFIGSGIEFVLSDLKSFAGTPSCIFTIPQM